MSRSLKKAPFVEEKLFNRISAMNANGEKKVLKQIVDEERVQQENQLEERESQ